MINDEKIMRNESIGINDITILEKGGVDNVVIIEDLKGFIWVLIVVLIIVAIASRYAK